MFWWFFDFLSRSLTNLQERGPKPPKKLDGIHFEFWMRIRDVYPGSATLQKKQDVTRLTSLLLYMDPFSFDAFWHLAVGSMYNKRLVKGPKLLKTGTALLSTN